MWIMEQFVVIKSIIFLNLLSIKRHYNVASNGDNNSDKKSEITQRIFFISAELCMIVLDSFNDAMSWWFFKNISLVSIKCAKFQFFIIHINEACRKCRELFIAKLFNNFLPYITFRFFATLFFLSNSWKRRRRKQTCLLSFDLNCQNVCILLQFFFINSLYARKNFLSR